LTFTASYGTRFWRQRGNRFSLPENDWPRDIWRAAMFD
jgi:hypothetical protein